MTAQTPHAADEAQNGDDFPEFMLPDEVSDRCRVAVNTVYQWIREGRLEAHKMGGVMRIPRTSFQTFLRVTKVTPEARAD